MLETLRWLLVVEFISLISIPFVWKAFPNLADRGWGFSKAVGLVVLGTCVWLLSYSQVLPNSVFGWWLVAGVLTALSIGLASRNRRGLSHFLRTRWRLLVAGELAFLGFFALVALLRAFIPNIEATEKPMELMLLNAAVTSQHAPPEDSWLSGHPVSYYYFGYWMVGGLSTMSSVATEYAFNLSLALFAGASASGIFTLASSLVRRDGGSQRAAIYVGLGAGVLLLFTATLAGWWELAAHLGIGTRGFYEWLGIDGLTTGRASAGWRPDHHWWWFRASRVINSYSETGAGLDFTIQEFPAFSFILGDLHPHVMSIPFVLAGIGVVANVYFSAERWGLGWLKQNRWSAAIGILVLGASGFINAWDILFLFSLLAGTVFFKVMRERSTGLAGALLGAVPAWAVMAVAAIAVYSPYYIGTLESQVQSPPLGPVAHGTRAVHFLTVWGWLFLLAAPFIALVLRKAIVPQVEKSWAAASVSHAGTIPSWNTWRLALALIGVPYGAWFVTHMGFNDGATFTDAFTRLVVAGPLAMLFVGLLAALSWRAKRGACDSTQFVLILAALSAYMLFWVELFFVHDLFGNRMNTVFKFYYEAWIAIALLSSFAVFGWWRLHRRLSGVAKIVSRTVAIVAAVLAIGPLYYPVAAAVTRASEHSVPATLDGLAWLREAAPTEYAAVQWLRANAERGTVIAEAVGGSYSAFGRISQTTGLPTVIGWTGHENQWRSDASVFAGREADVRELYETSEPATAEEIVRKYTIGYIIVGSRERTAYPGLEVSKFDTLGDRVFDQEDTVIYQVR